MSKTQEYVDNLAEETMNLVWQDEYSIGNDMVDEQHQTLFKLATEALLLKATHENSQRAQEKLRLIIKALFDYTVKHFSDEEEYMQSINYPELPAHKVRHHEILTIFRGFIHDIEDRSIEEIEDGLYNFVKAYFIEHITDMDRQIGLWALEHNK